MFPLIAAAGISGGFSLLDKLTGGSDSQSVSQPFDFKILKNNPLIGSGLLGLGFGVDPDPNALLPSNYQIPNYLQNSTVRFPTPYPSSPSAGGGSPTALDLPENFKFRTTMPPPDEGKDFNSADNITTHFTGDSTSFNFDNPGLKPNGKRKKGKAGQKPSNFINSLMEFMRQNPEETLYQNQGQLQAAGLGNLGLGFANAQNNIIGAQGNVNVGQEILGKIFNDAQSGSNQITNTANSNFDSFMNEYNKLSSGLSNATNFNDQSAGFANYSGDIINKALQGFGKANTLFNDSRNDKSIARDIALEDRSQRTNLINQALAQGINPTSQSLADQIYQSQIDQANSNLTSGDLADQLSGTFEQAQAAAAARGLGNASSPVLQAMMRVEKERLRLSDQARREASATRANTLLTDTQNQRGNILTAAGQVNQSAQNSLAQWAPLINAGTGAVNAGTNSLNAATASQEAGAGILSNAARTATDINRAGNTNLNTLLSGQNNLQSAIGQAVQVMQQGNQTGASANNNLINSQNSLAQTGLAQGQLGASVQQQGIDQMIQILNAVFGNQNNRQKLIIAKEAANAGAGGGISF
jgi:hypothetical protein